MSTGRVYGGESASDRSARRRALLLEAGLDIFGTTGYRQATVRQLCRAAGVTDRYFYEHFASTEDLLAAVYENCTETLRSAAVGKIADCGPDASVRDLARAGLEGFLSVAQADPRLARVVWAEVLGVSSRIESLYMHRMRDFGDLLIGLLDERDLRASAAEGNYTQRTLVDAAVGGVSHAVVAWAATDFEAPREHVTEALSALLTAAASALDEHRPI